MKKIPAYTTAVLLFAVTLLSACAAETAEAPEAAVEDDAAAEEAIEQGAEAIGSESDTVPLPTPVTGAKVPAVRVSGAVTSTLQIDILFLVDINDLVTAEYQQDLQAVATQLEAFSTPTDARYGLLLVGGASDSTSAAGWQGFTADIAGIVVALEPTAIVSDEVADLRDGLSLAIQLQDWRAGDAARFLIVIGNSSASLNAGNDDIAALISAADEQGIMISTIASSDLDAESEATFEQLALDTDGRLIILAEDGQPGETYSTLDAAVAAIVQEAVAVQQP